MADEKRSDEGAIPEEMSESYSTTRAQQGRDRGQHHDHYDDLGDLGAVGGTGGPGGPRFRIDASLTRTENVTTEDAALWAAIRNRTDAIRSDRYEDFINRVLAETQTQVSLAEETGVPEAAPDSHDDPEDEFYERPRPVKAVEDMGAPSIKERLADLKNAPSIYGVDAYNLLKLATQAFLLLETGVFIGNRDSVTGHLYQHDLIEGEESRTGERLTFKQLNFRLERYLRQTLTGTSGSAFGLPYLKRIARALVDTDPRDEELPYGLAVMRHRFTSPSLQELIWSYWHEEGMLVQTMNAICMRFQNRRGPQEQDPLANLEIDPLRPLNNLLWGYIQDEYNRLTVARRAYEYDHQYGLKIVGRAVPELRSADSRSKFIEAFHNLLYRTAAFYRADADTTVIADGFSLLSSLREVHLLLAEGAHNQFGDLPWTARAEMLMMQWMLGRPEMREFLRGRAMVPYTERWMGQVDSMKKLQGWTDVSVQHFRNLGVYGEQILLAIRYGNWNEINDQANAKTWARYWRPEIQGYIHAYSSACGIDLSEDIVDNRAAPARYAQPSSLLAERLSAQGMQGGPPPALPAGGVSFGALPGARRRALNPGRKG
jgi:hypothetical protein